MQKLSFVDETFDLNFISEYHLSIQLCLDGLSFSVLDGIQKKYVLLEHLPVISNTPALAANHFTHFHENNEKLNAGFKSTKIIYASPKASLLPAIFIQEKNIQQAYETSFGKLKNEQIFKNTLNSIPEKLVFGVPASLVRFIKKEYPNINITHECVPFLWNAMRSENSKKMLALLVRKNYIWIVYMENNQLKFCNSFTYQNDEDILYFVLNTISGLGIDPEKTPVFTEGIISKKTATYHRLRQYVKVVQLAEASSDYQFSYLFDQLPDARFVTLLNLQACVS